MIILCIDHQDYTWVGRRNYFETHVYYDICQVAFPIPFHHAALDAIKVMSLCPTEQVQVPRGQNRAKYARVAPCDNNLLK